MPEHPNKPMHDKEGRVIDPDIAHAMADETERQTAKGRIAEFPQLAEILIQGEGNKAYFEKLTPRERQEVDALEIRSFFIEDLKKNQHLLKNLEKSLYSEYKTPEDVVKMENDGNAIVVKVVRSSGNVLEHIDLEPFVVKVVVWQKNDDQKTYTDVTVSSEPFVVTSSPEYKSFPMESFRYRKEFFDDLLQHYKHWFFDTNYIQD